MCSLKGHAIRLSFVSHVFCICACFHPPLWEPLAGPESCQSRQDLRKGVDPRCEQQLFDPLAMLFHPADNALGPFGRRKPEPFKQMGPNNQCTSRRCYQSKGWRICPFPSQADSEIALVHIAGSLLLICLARWLQRQGYSRDVTNPPFASKKPCIRHQGLVGGLRRFERWSGLSLCGHGFYDVAWYSGAHG